MDIREAVVMSDYVELVSGDLNLRWRFGHTVNVYLYGREVDCFTFDWADDAPTVDRFLVLAREYVRDADLVGMGAE